MKYLLFIFCFTTAILKGQVLSGPNSAYYNTFPVCPPYVDVPTISLVNNNPLNTTVNVCVNQPVTFHFQGTFFGSDNEVDMGDECGWLGYWDVWPYFMSGPTANFYIDYAYNAPGTYVVNVIRGVGFSQGGCIIDRTTVNVVDCSNASSTANCQGSFRPTAGDYVVSFWVKDDVPLGAITYSSGIEVVLTGMAGGPVTLPVYANDVSNAQNTIIDGWQKVEKVITIPPDATGIEVALKSRMATADTYFDDIRIHPFNSSFKSYVYDPVTLRLAAELDERNYATFYEYDEEGQLVRVKKETERGIKTIKESRTNVSK